MKAEEGALDRFGRSIARWLDRPQEGLTPYTHPDLAALEAVMKPADVLLVEGTSQVSGAIKYLTQSTWSHSALYIGHELDRDGPPMLVEVNLGEGCVASPLAKYELNNIRICRARSLDDNDRAAVVSFMIRRLGLLYDMRNIFDLMRFFLPNPPVPRRWRRQMLVIGAGDPTRAICSSLIAQAFQSIHYPILPTITQEDRRDPRARQRRREILQIRHHSLYSPRDFDLSPYFEIVKPTLAAGFDHRRLRWAPAKALEAHLAARAKKQAG